MAVSITDLVPEFQDKVALLLQRCAARGITMVPSHTVRSPHVQARYWRQSRSRQQVDAAIEMLRNVGAPYLAEVLSSVGPQEGRDVTSALPGNSWHQWGEAVDCFWLVDNKAEWSTHRLVDGLNGFEVYAEEAKALGLDPGHYWTSRDDAPHVQLRATASPLAAGLTWPEIDQVMQERFGPRLTTRLLSVTSSKLRLSYEAPEGWRVFETSDVPAAVFRAKMSVCADGAPRAYHPDSATGLDNLINAGRPGNWYGICTDAAGEPLVQGPGDPAPGYYVSKTALNNAGAAPNTPARYVDASTIPYIVLPGGGRSRHFTASEASLLGDVGVAYNIKTGALSFAQCCDIGPAREIGEGSLALAAALGLKADARHGGADKRDILYVVFPGSGRGSGLPLDEIRARAEPLFEGWGGLARLRACEDV
ncbi:glycoside hydrolase family 75 protein [Aquabacter sp. P-9]|uniref:glycoside hydrolase family 75 protein n=1 Tax=Aquabacter sediminis TaxID=3029197 RepID=UPI00237EE44B|nr:glycoside hydrolase family 75 protein [Aquabacter sp. P-9]MDE1568197.1 glycoside hydrolase family 75 protein [Aquabacter sp. P-9]